jgi:hypothetical protein
VIYLHHLIYPPVTFYATYPPIDVDRVVEVNVVGCLVNAYPRNGLTVQDAVTIGILVSGEIAVPVDVFPVIGGPDRFEERGVALDGFVAGHADVGGGDAGASRLVYRMVAIPTVQPKLSCMKAVVVADGLCRLISYPGIFGGCVIGDAGNYCSSHHAQGND